MIRLANSLWIGNSAAADGCNLGALGIGAVLNVAQDLRGKVGWPEVEYAQVGLIDGPGNPPAAYAAAVLTLATLLHRGKVLVCCHTGSRSLAVVVMYLEARRASERGWDGWLTVLRERCDIDLPVPHEAHRAAFEAVDWRALATLVEG